MKTYVKRIIIKTTCGLALLVTTSAWAGWTTSWPVTIKKTETYNSASGNLVTAALSRDVNQLIGCRVRANASGLYMTCEAEDDRGNWLVCNTSDPVAISSAASVTSHASLYFGVELGKSTCASVWPSTSSTNLR